MNIHNILKTFKLCELSYKNLNEINYNEELILIENKETDVQCFLFFDNKINTIFVIFRGTSSFTDKIIDLKINKVDFFYNTKIHKGFYEQYMSIRSQLITKLNLYKDSYNIITGGHSLGGALATLLAFEYKCDCITIGSPRVGNKRFAKIYNDNVKKTLRIMNEFDPIPKTPNYGYKHVSKGFSIFNNNYVDNKKINLCICKKGFLNINAHYMNYYIDNINTTNLNKFLDSNSIGNTA